MLVYAGAHLIRINVNEPQVPGPKDVGLSMRGLAALEAIDALLKPQG